MPLPKIATPTYELVLPSSNKKIKYRPFLVKEEKILILAIESDSLKEISRSIKDILKNCILTKGVKVDPKIVVSVPISLIIVSWLLDILLIP